ncbi:MAG TPA: hypothetical protein PKH58_13700 [Paludibacteraceae bacterium]|nr:hypothetical protein [Paludibacteraceae bacterium]
MKTTIFKISVLILSLSPIVFSCSDKENNSPNISKTKGSGNVHYDNTINSLNGGVLKINSAAQTYILYDLILFSTNYNFDLNTGKLTHGNFSPLNYVKFTICLSKTTADLNGDGIINSNDMSASDVSLPLGKYSFNNAYVNSTFTGGEFSKNDPATKLHIIQSGTLEIKHENNLYAINYDGKDTDGVSLYCDYKGKIGFVYNGKYIN